MAPLRDWRQRLLRWLRQFFSKRRERPRILKRHYSKHCAVLSLERNTPGAISTWRIVPRHSAGWDLLVTLDSLSTLVCELAGESAVSDQKCDADRYCSLAPSIRRTMEFKATPFTSHRFAVHWISQSLDAGGNVRLYNLCLVDADLQGISGTNGDRYALLFGEAIAKSLLQIDPRRVPPEKAWDNRELNSILYHLLGCMEPDIVDPATRWIAILSSKNWLKELDTLALAHLGKGHVLQPRPQRE